jgi:hypothetical protein
MVILKQNNQCIASEFPPPAACRVVRPFQDLQASSQAHFSDILVWTISERMLLDVYRLCQKELPRHVAFQETRTIKSDDIEPSESHLILNLHISGSTFDLDVMPCGPNDFCYSRVPQGQRRPIIHGNRLHDDTVLNETMEILIDREPSTCD